MRALSVVYVCVATGAVAAAQAPAVPADSRIVSIHPFTVQRGATSVVTVRGSAIQRATAVFLESVPLTATIEGEEAEPPGQATGRNRAPMELVRLRIQAAADAKPGRYPLRLITPQGVTNALPLRITEHPVFAEPAGAHETPETAVPVEKLPAVFTGRIQRRGETDHYAFDVESGQVLTFEAVSGLPAPGAAGGNASGFDPSLSIFERSGSWFDAKRLNRIAFNDEPLWVLGQPTDAYLVHKFERPGRYFLRVEAFSGQGGPDYSYELKILPGNVPQEATPRSARSAERAFTRRLSPNRLSELAERGGKPQNPKSIETYRAAPAGSGDAPLFKIPGTIEGRLTKPGETDRARFHLDGPQDIAIEVETTALAPPLFNPIVRLLDATGEEVATNLFAGRGACSGALNKSLQAKTILPLREAGDYPVEIRDMTADLAGEDFRYRVQIRPQIPHIGQVNIDVDHLNLAPGDAKTVRVTFDREEDYRGAVAVLAESLPPGVQALAAADFEADKDPPSTIGKRERYTARGERAVVAFTAAADAASMEQPMEQPQMARLVVRPIVDGKPGAVVASKQFPIMVIAKRNAGARP